MIFYFSGTGNSQLTAKQIAETTGDEMISINRCLKKGEKKTFRSERSLVFVTPTYAWRIPKVVERWIHETSFEGNSNAYFVLTCGGSCGNAAAYARKLCAKKGMRFYGLAQVIMPENYVAMFIVPDEPESHAIREKAKPYIAELAARIQNGEPFPKTRMSFRSRLLSGPVNLLYYPFVVHDKGFTVSDDCVSCGKCAQRCILNNIDMINKKPVWKGNCTHCMACIGGCPTEAIEYQSKWGNSSHGKPRFYMMKD